MESSRLENLRCEAKKWEEILTELLDCPRAEYLTFVRGNMSILFWHLQAFYRIEGLYQRLHFCE